MSIPTTILDRVIVDGGAWLMLLARRSVPPVWGAVIERPLEGRLAELVGLDAAGREICRSERFTAADERVGSSAIALPERLVAIEQVFSSGGLACARIEEARERFDLVWRRNLDQALGECMVWGGRRTPSPSEDAPTQSGKRKVGRPRKHPDDHARKQAAEQKLRAAGFVRVTVKVRADLADTLRDFAKTLK